MESAHFVLEKHFWSLGKKCIVGIDEVGRGAWAGPLVIGAVIFSEENPFPELLYDSKRLKPSERVRLAQKIKVHALDHAVIEVSVDEIDKKGLGEATQLGFRKALGRLELKPDFVLIDGFSIKDHPALRQLAIIKGDQISASIAAASIIAKVYRDQLMREISLEFPGFDFKQNKGYGTKLHQLALSRHGPTKIHRTSFRSISALSRDG